MKNLISLSSKSINKNTVARYLILQMEKKNEKRKRKKKSRILFWAKGHKQHCGVSKYMLKLLGAVVLLQSLQSCGDICKRAEQD